MKKLAIVLTLLLAPATAFAYPTAAVFTPTGEAKPLGTVGVLAYVSTNLSPRISPGSTWVGVEGGVLPQFDYGNSGVKFGGLEVGFDTISPYGAGIVKPVFNAKLGAITEGKLSPAVALGIMEMSPALPSMNFGYVSATKTLQFGEHPSFGRLTLGVGGNLGSRTQFNGTFPFPNTRLALMAAYESPVIAKHLGFVVDYLSGSSEISSTYGGATWLLGDSTTVAAGAFLSNDRAVAPVYDGFFGYISTTFDFAKGN